MNFLPAPPPQKLLTAGDPHYHMGVDYASCLDRTVEMRVTYYDLDTDHPRMVARIGKTILWEGPARVVFMKPIDVPWR